MEALNLVCRSKAEIGILGGIYFLGWASSVLVIPPLSDKIGRRKITAFCVALQFPFLIILMTGKTYLMILVSMFALGVLTSGSVVCSFLYMAEFFSPNNFALVNSVSEIFLCSVLGLATFFY